MRGTPAEPPRTAKPLIVVDCGSSKTRAYHVGRGAGGKLFCRYLCNLPKIVDAMALPQPGGDGEGGRTFVQRLEAVIESFAVNVDVVIAATAGLRQAKAAGTVTAELEAQFVAKLPSSCTLHQLTGSREAELEFVAAKHLMQENSDQDPRLRESHPSGGLGMMSMGGKSMQFVQVAEAGACGSGGGTGLPSFSSMEFAAHSAKAMLRAAPEPRSEEEKRRAPPVPKRLFVARLMECTATVKRSCAAMLASGEICELSGVVMGITGCASVAAYAGFEGRAVSREQALSYCDHFMEKMTSSLDAVDDAPTEEFKQESTLGVLAKMVVFRTAVSEMLGPDSLLICRTEWGESPVAGGGKSDGGAAAADADADAQEAAVINVEWSLGIYLEREAASASVGRSVEQRAVRGGETRGRGVPAMDTRRGESGSRKRIKSIE